jgi:uncharacterized membrane protein YphA (DoxX/SURF4 family)
MNVWSIIIGLGFLGAGIYSLFRVITKKASEKDRLVFYHQIFPFKLLFGEKHAYNSLVILTSIIEIGAGLAFLTGLISW